MRTEDPYERHQKAGGLAERLVECDKLLGGRTKAEVRDLLGRPGGRHEGGRIWTYNVGVPEELSDYLPLEVAFGRDGRVRRARIPGYVEP